MKNRKLVITLIAGAVLTLTQAGYAAQEAALQPIQPKAQQAEREKKLEIIKEKMKEFELIIEKIKSSSSPCDVSEQEQQKIVTILQDIDIEMNSLAGDEELVSKWYYIGSWVSSFKQLKNSIFCALENIKIDKKFIFDEKDTYPLHTEPIHIPLGSTFSLRYHATAGWCNCTEEQGDPETDTFDASLFSSDTLEQISSGSGGRKCFDLYNRNKDFCFWMNAMKQEYREYEYKGVDYCSPAVFFFNFKATKKGPASVFVTHHFKRDWPPLSGKQPITGYLMRFVVEEPQETTPEQAVESKEAAPAFEQATSDTE